MKMLLILTFSLLMPGLADAQTQNHDFGSCFGKANRKSIVSKMDNFMRRVSGETGCPADKLTYTVDEYYTVFYSKACRHLPKKITFDACGEKRTYQHQGLSGNITDWLLGSWVLVKS